MRTAIQDAPAVADTPVHGAICFTNSDWSSFAKPFQLRDVTVTYPGALLDTVRTPAVLTADDVQRIATRVALHLKAAV